MSNSPTQAGNIDRFDITSNTGGGSIDVSAGIVDFRYYESVLSNTVTAFFTQIIETGNSDLGQGTLDGLPIRGGERSSLSVTIKVVHYNFPLYVNRKQRWYSWYSERCLYC